MPEVQSVSQVEQEVQLERLIQEAVQEIRVKIPLGSNVIIAEVEYNGELSVRNFVINNLEKYLVQKKFKVADRKNLLDYQSKHKDILTHFDLDVPTGKMIGNLTNTRVILTCRIVGSISEGELYLRSLDLDKLIVELVCKIIEPTPNTSSLNDPEVVEKPLSKDDLLREEFSKKKDELLDLFEAKEEVAVSHELKKPSESTSFVKKEYWTNGKLKCSIPYHHGKVSGLYEAFDETGQLRLKTNYENGLKEGEEIFYFSTGQKRIETFYVNDKIDGVERHYNEKGKLLYEVPYKDSLVHGIEKIYNKRGELEMEIKFEQGVRVQH